MGFNTKKSLANNKGADQPAHPRRLISAFIIHFLESIISRLATSKNEPCCEKTCLLGFVTIKLTQLQRLDRILKFCMSLVCLGPAFLHTYLHIVDFA